MHWKWLDPLVILVRDVAAILFHFHPVAWWAGKRQTEAMELACDRALLVNDSDASNYAEQLYQILKNIRHRRRVPVAGGLFATRTQVGKRIAVLLGATIASRPQLTVFSVLGVLLFAAGALAVGGGVRSDEATEPSGKTTGNERVLRFSRTQTVGIIRIRQPRPLGMDWSQGWEVVGPARGTVRVPADRDVWLIVRVGMADPRALSGLGPDDIQVISTSSDAVIASLTGWTGLKWLVKHDSLPRKAGLAHLSGLKSLEGLVTSDSQITDDELRTLVGHLKGLKSFRWLELGKTQLTDAGLAHLRDCRSLKTLLFGSNKMTGSGLSHLADLPELEEIGVGGMVMGDEFLERVAECTSLKRLTPNCPSITDAGVAHLAKLKSLETLNLRWVPVGDAGLAHLSGLKSLRELNLRDTKVTDAGLAHLAELTSLERLMLPRGTTDAGLAKLRDLKGLKYLELGETQFTGVGLESLRDMKSLEYLRPPGDITDDELAIIGGMPLLKELWISSGSVTNDGLSHLKSLKSLEILRLFAGEITGSGLAHLRGLPLKRLNVAFGRLDESRLTHLGGLSQLQHLSIGGPLEDDDLASVGKLTRLKTLRVDCRTLSDGAMAHLGNLASLERLDAWFAVTDNGLKHVAKLRKLNSLQVHGEFSNSGLQQLQGLKSLQMLYILTDNEPSSATLKRLRSKLPVLSILSVLKRGKVKPRPKIGQMAPTFTVQTLDEQQLRLKDYRGKVVLLYFWATWCKPCVASTPALKAEYEKFSEDRDFQMISLSLDDDEGQVRWHVEGHQLSWPQVRLGLDSEVAANYGVSGVPAYFVIGPKGTVLYDGGLKWDEIKAAVVKNLKRSRSRK